MAYFADYREHVGSDPARFFKTTLFQSARMLVGMDCLEPGQSQAAHRHAGRDKVYYVIEGEGMFTIGEERRLCGAGAVVWAPADVVHSVEHSGVARLVMLIGMAPEPG